MHSAGARAPKLLMRAATAAAMCGHLLIAGTTVWAEDGPAQKELRVLYGYPAVRESRPRMVAERLAARLQLPLRFENIPAGNGDIAADRAANAPADGLSLYIAGSPTMGIHLSLSDDLSYSPVRDFAEVTQLFGFAHVLVVGRELPVRNVRELVAFSKERPGTLSYGHFGVGSPVHIKTEHLKRLTGLEARPAFYKTPHALLSDLAAGRVSMCLCSMQTAMLLADQRLANALAVTSARRSGFAPRVPTIAEAGVSGYEFTSWLGLVVPAGTPAPIIARLHGHATAVLASADVRAALSDAMMYPIGNTPTEFAITVNSEISAWRTMIKELGIRLNY